MNKTRLKGGGCCVNDVIGANCIFLNSLHNYIINWVSNLNINGNVVARWIIQKCVLYLRWQSMWISCGLYRMWMVTLIIYILYGIKTLKFFTTLWTFTLIEMYIWQWHLFFPGSSLVTRFGLFFMHSLPQCIILWCETVVTC